MLKGTVITVPNLSMSVEWHETNLAVGEALANPSLSLDRLCSDTAPARPSGSGLAAA
jgi:hypothetical protein